MWLCFSLTVYWLFVFTCVVFYFDVISGSCLVLRLCCCLGVFDGVVFCYECVC